MAILDALMALTPSDISSMGLPRLPSRALADALIAEQQRHGLATSGSAVEFRVIPHRELRKIRPLGAGAFGDVYLAYYEGGHVEVAVKANQADAKDVEAIHNERRLLETLLSKPHKNVVTVYGICTDAPGKMLLVMDYCSSGSLEDYLKSHVSGSVGQSDNMPTPVLACAVACT